MSYEILGCSDDLSVKKVQIVAELVGVQSKVKAVGTTKCSSSLLQEAQVIIPDGTSLPTSVALRYLGRLRPDLCLYGRTFTETALVDKAFRYSEYSIAIPLMTLSNIPSADSAASKQVKKDIMCSLTMILEPQLLKTTYFVGERMTIADIDLALTIQDAVSSDVLSQEGLCSCPSIQRWLTLILQHPVVKRLYKHKETKSGKPTQQPSKATQSQKKADTHEDEEEEEPRPKKVNPLEALPPSSFSLEAWKRQYSNTKDLKGVAMPWFWQHFDTQGWSIWYMHYDKQPGENTEGYRTANLLGGFLQRVEQQFRQYSFAVINVVGTKGDFDIKGIWLLRGSEIPMELKDHPSFEFHSFKKLDPASTQDKSLIEEYWCSDDIVEKRPIDSCKVWK